MDLGDLFVMRDSRGLYLSQVVGEKFGTSWPDLNKEFWKIVTLYALGNTQHGGALDRGGHYFVNKEKSNHWVWI